MALNPVHQIQAFNAGRDAELLALKYRKLRASPFVFMRGTCHLFYDRFSSTTDLKKSPPVWVCGDLHLENFGSYKADNRLVYFDINDFDESALAPASWELVRMLASIELGAAEMGIADATLPTLRQDFLQAYVGALSSGKAYWFGRETAQGPVRDLLDGERARTRVEWLDSRTERKSRHRVIRLDGKKALPATQAKREAVTEFLNTFAATQSDPAFFEVLDVARRVAGTGSLGLERYAVLVKGKARAKSDVDGNYLLDLKFAQESSVVPHVALAQPRWGNNAQRVVALQQRMQAVPMAFLHALQWGKRSFVLRALQPSEDRVAIVPGSHAVNASRQVLHSMGELVAWAQIRSAGRQGSATVDELIDFAQASKWQTNFIESARACVDQLRKDATEFNAAFDDGVFGSPTAHSVKG